MIELIFRNLFILYLGAFIRFLFHRFIKNNKQITFNFILNGIDKEKIKEDEIFNARNELMNRLYAFAFFIFIIIIIIISQWK